MTYADKITVYWLDLKKTLLGKDGMLRKNFMINILHTNVEGYREWAMAMEPNPTKLFVI